MKTLLKLVVALLFVPIAYTAFFVLGLSVAILSTVGFNFKITKRSL